MSDKRMNAIGRRLQFRRRLRGEKKGVSPVVATLILILIAVAAAAALYLWLVAWQGGVTSGIGSPGAQYTLTIGGSTSVYPMAQLAVAQFEANNTDVAISLNQGGSGAGMAAVCSGQIDIGEASTFYGTGLQPASSPGAIESTYGCPATTSIQVIAYDGVDPIVSSTNTHALQNLSWDTLQGIYVSASTADNAPPTSGSNEYLQGNYHQDGQLAPVQPSGTASYTWNQIPACAAPYAGKTFTNGVNDCGGKAGNAPIVESLAASGTLTPSTFTWAAGGGPTVAAGAPSAETGSFYFTYPTGTGTPPYGETTGASIAFTAATSVTANSATTATFPSILLGTTPETNGALAAGAYTGTLQTTFTVPSGFVWASAADDGANTIFTATDLAVSGTGCTGSGQTDTGSATYVSVSGTTLTLTYPFSVTIAGGSCATGTLALPAGDAAVQDVPTASAVSITSQTGGTESVTAPIGVSYTVDSLLTGEGQTLALATPQLNILQTGPGAACTNQVNGPSGDICAATPPAGDLVGGSGMVSPCGFTVCAGGSNVTIGVNIRSDVSGTQQSFISRALAIGAPANSSTANPLNIGFSGCSGDNQWDGCGMAFPSADGHNGNPAVISAVAAQPNGIGFASDGLVQGGATSGTVPVNFQGYGQSVVVTIVGESKATAAIAKAIADHELNVATYATDQAYVGWRPFLNVETSPPTGEALRYLTFVMDPANNQALAGEAAEISVYNSALLSAGVPVTPV